MSPSSPPSPHSQVMTSPGVALVLLWLIVFALSFPLVDLTLSSSVILALVSLNFPEICCGGRVGARGSDGRVIGFWGNVGLQREASTFAIIAAILLGRLLFKSTTIDIALDDGSVSGTNAPRDDESIGGCEDGNRCEELSSCVSIRSSPLRVVSWAL